MRSGEHYVIIRLMRWAGCVVLMLIFAGFGSSQNADATRLGESVDLAGKWLFHRGDNPEWAKPGIDDSSWKVVSSRKDWYSTDSDLKGYFWYRLHVKLAPQHGPLKLLFSYMGNPYEVFVNGRSVGRFGDFPPHDQIIRPLVRIYAIPEDTAAGESMAIAVRFWTSPLFRHGWGGIRGWRPVVLGKPDAIDQEFKVQQAGVIYSWLPDISVRIFSLLLGAGLIILYRLHPGNREYLWIALYAVTMSAWTVTVDYQAVLPMELELRSFLDMGLTVASEFLLFQFVFAFLKRSMPGWVRGYQISLLFQIVTVLLFFEGWMTESILDTMLLVWNFPYAFLLPGFVLWRYLRGHKEAVLLIAPLFLINLNDILNSLSWLLFELKLRKTSADLIPPFQLGVVPLYIGQVEGLFFMLSIGALLLYRFHKTSQDQARAHAELEAARSMQDVMLPKQVQTIPGFNVESAYIPAQEVGGDFFQLFPGEDESLLVVIGDVSGKGVKAAMLVSLIMGLLQRTVEDIRQPGALLRELNRMLQGQTDGRFATCCCASISRDGHVALANAGHLSPYCDGKELEAPGGLPLALAPDVEYPQVSFNVPHGQRIVFLSDGVVEARNKAGELYGFERTRIISIQPVNEIAHTAQRFGQEDDITVVGIQRQVVFA